MTPVVASETRPGRLSHLTLRTRMVFLVVALLVLGLAISTIGATTLLKSYLVNQLDRQLTSAAQAAGGKRVDEVTSYYTSAGGLPSNYFFQLSDRTGKAVRSEIQPDTARNWGLPDLPDLPENVVDRLGGEPFTVRGATGAPMRSDPVSSWRVVALNTVDTQGDYGGTFIVALPLGDIESTTSQLAKILGFTCLGIVILGGLGGFFAVRRSLRPLLMIEATAKAIAEGDLGQRIPPIPASTEVGSLAQSLNVMLAQIEESFDAQAASEARMRQFISDASHELRTPLVSIRGYSELFRMGAITTQEQTADTLKRIEGSAIQMGHLVEDLLALARLDESHVLSSSPVDLLAISRDAAADLIAMDPARDVQVVRLDAGRLQAAGTGTGTDTGTGADGFIPEEVVDSSRVPDEEFASQCVVVGDEVRLRQVLTNLIGNVFTHTPAATPVEIGIGPAPGDQVVVEIRDHGPGIPAEQSQQVFERFHRVDASRNSASGGSGLGLAIVESIVSAHGGSVAVGPTSGGGATVQLRLPRPTTTQG